MIRKLQFVLIVLIIASFAASDVASQQARKRPDGRRPGSKRKPDTLKVGDMAPDFTLKTLDGDQTVKLGSFRGKKPVALVFGSYT